MTWGGTVGCGLIAYPRRGCPQHQGNLGLPLPTICHPLPSVILSSDQPQGNRKVNTLVTNSAVLTERAFPCVLFLWCHSRHGPTCLWSRAFMHPQALARLCVCLISLLTTSQWKRKPGSLLIGGFHSLERQTDRAISTLFQGTCVRRRHDGCC